MDKHFWYSSQFNVVSTSNLFRKRRRCIAERLSKMSSNVREMLIKMLGDINKAGVVWSFPLEKMALASIWFDGKVCLIAFHIEELSFFASSISLQ